MDTSRSKSSSNVSDLQGLREREDGNKDQIPRSHPMNMSRSKSSSHSNDLHGQREREEQGNMNRLSRSHQSNRVGLPSHLEGPAQRTSHGDDSGTLRMCDMNTSRSESSSNLNDLHGQRGRENGNFNRLSRSHPKNHVGKPSHLEGPAQRTSHGYDSGTSKLRGMNALANKEEQDIKMNHISHTASKNKKRPSS